MIYFNKEVTLPYLNGNPEGQGKYEIANAVDTRTQCIIAFLNAFLILISLVRAFFFLQIWERPAQVVKLIGRTLEQTRVFVLIYLATIAIFSVINKVLGNEIENSFDTEEERFGQGPEYHNIPSALMNLVLMFRNAIGDYQIPNYKYWSTVLDSRNAQPQSSNVAKNSGFLSATGSGSVLEPTLMVYVIWLFWFGTIIFLPIVQLNFLIAFISEAFEDVLDTSMEILYVQRCKLNLEYYIIRRFASNLKGCFCFCLRKRGVSCEIYLISGDANLDKRQGGEGGPESMGVVHKLKGVLKDVK